ncbi:MAG: ATP-binding protein [Spirochaetales bacterium]|uniref:histidine kinase n=1 Tax=Candidatus Thalassospirochaeta sargassi TaxID=3119039 RepID=A0AAJ1IE12_9SPIO|nr:ATP-binding protein [Spirochaetales bacterium]
MAISSKKAGASRSGLISVFLIYILLIILIYYLTGEVLRGMPTSGATGLILILAGMVLPLALLVYVGINVRKLVIDTRNGSPGARFKTHLILFFSLIVIMTSIPQAIVSMRFVNTAVNAWFAPEIGNAINGGLNLSLAYYNDKIDTLVDFAEGPVFNNMLSDIERSPQRMWTNIHNANPGIDSIQIFNTDGETIFFNGQNGTELDIPPSLDGANGLLPREDRETTSLLRYLQMYETGSRKYSVIISALLPQNLDETARSLTEAREVFLTFQKNQQDFSVLLLVFYTFLSIPLILLSILISFLLSDEVIRPIVSLEAATRRVSEGDYSYRILTRSGDELSNLTKSFNQMMSELENSRKKILQTEKITAWQEIARQLAHELRNPLTPIKLSSERLLRKYKNDPENLSSVLEPAINNIITEVNALDNLLREFRDFSRIPAPSLSMQNISEIINETIDTYRMSYPGIKFKFSSEHESIELEVDPAQMKQVFSNLLKNACEALPPVDGLISIQTDLVRKGNSSYCRIRVQDNGSGIDPEKQEQVFNPYFTTKTEGTGLGLPIVERIIFDHKGQIWFESDKGHGTTFFIDLPLEKKFG